MYQSAGIILAGGHSRRMGQDKGLLPLPGGGGEMFVEHLASLLAVRCSELVLVTRDAAQAAHYAEHSLPSVRIVTDDVPDYGPLMGLYSGLSAIQSPYALVTAVDTPLLQPAVIAYLLSQAGDDHLLVPIVDGIPQVLLAIYPRSILPIIEMCLQQKRRDPRSLLQVTPVRYIEEAQLRSIDPQLRSFVNVNTPGEFATLSEHPIA